MSQPRFPLNDLASSYRSLSYHGPSSPARKGTSPSKQTDKENVDAYRANGSDPTHSGTQFVPMDLDLPSPVQTQLAPATPDQASSSMEAEQTFDDFLSGYKHEAAAVATATSSSFQFVFFDKEGRAYPSESPSASPLLQLIISNYNAEFEDDMAAFVNSAFQGTDNTPERRQHLSDFALAGFKRTKGAPNYMPLYKKIGEGRTARYRCRFSHQPGEKNEWDKANSAESHMDRVHFPKTKYMCQGTKTHAACPASFYFMTLLRNHYEDAVADIIPSSITMVEPGEQGPTQPTLPNLATLPNPPASISSALTMSTAANQATPAVDRSKPLTQAELAAPVTGTPLIEDPPTRYRTVEALNAYAAECFIHTADPAPLRALLVSIMNKKEPPGLNDIRPFIEAVNHPVADTNTFEEVHCCRFCDAPGMARTRYQSTRTANRHIKEQHIQYFTYLCTEKLCGNDECAQIFPSTGFLKLHGNSKKPCEACGLLVVPKSMNEHMKTARCIKKAALLKKETTLLNKP